MAISSATSTPSVASSYPSRAKPTGDDGAANAAKDDTKHAQQGAKGAITTVKMQAPAEPPSAITAFASGALGLEDPSKPKPVEEEPNGFYTAGRALAVLGTLGTIASVLA